MVPIYNKTFGTYSSVNVNINFCFSRTPEKNIALQIILKFQLMCEMWTQETKFYLII